MTRVIGCLSLTVLLPAVVAAHGADAETFTLRYQFHPGETVRWDVVHQLNVRTTVAGTTQTAETLSKSVKVWRVTGVDENGAATFEHRVEDVDMRHNLTGSAEVRYNSRTDKKAPPGFEHVAASVGVPLSIVTIDRLGKVVRRERKQVKGAAPNEGDITIPLPDGPVAVGHTWSFRHTVDVTLNNGTIKKVDTLQRFKLEGVKTGVATIHISTTVLTPVHDPAVRSQLIQRESAGEVRFDIDGGRVLSQQMDLDKGVVGFRGEASSLHYLTRFTEKLQPEAARTATPPGKRQR